MQTPFKQNYRKCLPIFFCNAMTPQMHTTLDDASTTMSLLWRRVNNGALIWAEPSSFFGKSHYDFFLRWVHFPLFALFSYIDLIGWLALLEPDVNRGWLYSTSFLLNIIYLLQNKSRPPRLPLNHLVLIGSFGAPMAARLNLSRVPTESVLMWALRPQSWCH